MVLAFRYSDAELARAPTPMVQYLHLVPVALRTCDVRRYQMIPDESCRTPEDNTSSRNN